MEQAISILNQFGITAFWGLIVYKLLDLIQIVVVLLLIGYGLKKAAPFFLKLMD